MAVRLSLEKAFRTWFRGNKDQRSSVRKSLRYSLNLRRDLNRMGPEGPTRFGLLFLDVEEFDFENQGGVRTDGLPGAAWAIGEICRHVEFPLGTDLH